MAISVELTERQLVLSFFFMTYKARYFTGVDYRPFDCNCIKPVEVQKENWLISFAAILIE